MLPERESNGAGHEGRTRDIYLGKVSAEVAQGFKDASQFTQRGLKPGSAPANTLHGSRNASLFTACVRNQVRNRIDDSARMKRDE
jgi:hypothetical protein